MMKMKSVNRKYIIGLVALVALFSLVLFGAVRAFAYIPRTDNPTGTDGTVGTNGEISGGAHFRVLSSQDPAFIPYVGSTKDIFVYGSDGLNIKYPDGTTDTGGIWHFDHIQGVNSSGQTYSITSNNGYLMIGQSEFDAWIKEFKGDSSYVKSHDFATTFEDNNGDQFTVYNIAEILQDSGGHFDPSSTADTYDPTVWVSNLPTSQITLPSGTSVQQGNKLAFNAISGIEAYHSNYHYEYAEVISSSGQDVTNQAIGTLEGNVSGGQVLTVQAQSGQATMQEITGGGATDYPPTMQTWTNGQGGTAGYSTPNYINATNLQPGTYTIYLYVKDFYNREAVTASQNFTVAPGNGGPSITLTANPSTTTSGSPSTITYNVANFAPGDYVKVSGSGGQNMWSVANDTKSTDSFNETENPQNGAATTVNYTATVYDSSGVAQSTATTSAIWTSQSALTETITLTANPTSLYSGDYSTVSYTATNLQPGDIVEITQVKVGTSSPAINKDFYTATGSLPEVEYPVNGSTQTDQFGASIYNSKGQFIAGSSIVNVTWKSLTPTITLTANPQSMVPGQSSTISYSVNTLPSGDTVSISGTGNATNVWSTSGQTQLNENYMEIESPSSGQTISETYTGEILDNQGNVLSTSNVTVTWVNNWNGTISLSANPSILPTDSPTALKATTTQAIPNGYTLQIFDETTGQLVSSSGSSPESSNYSSFNAETDTFIAVVNDGYEDLGTPSNTVDVTWAGLALSANPTQLPQGSTSTVTVTGQNVPSGDYLVIYNQTTGQQLGYSQSTPYSVQVTEQSPQTDTFVAYISSTTSSSNSLVASNTVSVDWYGVTLVASPTRLPVSGTSNLTATAQNLPSGYVLDIVDQTTNQVIASGAPGQTVLNVPQTKNTPETDSYIAQIAEPGNPPIPGLSVPGSSASLNGSWTRFYGDTNTGTSGIYEDGNNLYLAKTYGTNIGLFSGVFQQGASYSPNQIFTGPSQVYDVLKCGGHLYAADGTNGVYELNGSSWTQIMPGLGYYWMRFATDGTNLYAYYQDFPAGYGVDEWNGYSWNTVAPIDNTLMTVASGNGSAYVVYETAVKQYMGSTLMATFNPPSGTYIDDAFYASNNTLYISTNLGIYEWNGSQWIFLFNPGVTIAYMAYGDGMLFVADNLDYTYQHHVFVYSNGSYQTLGSSIQFNSVAKLYFSNNTLFAGTTDDYDWYYPFVPGVTYFPIWTFNNMPSYIPTSLFPNRAQASSDGNNALWVTGSSTQNNGTAFFENTFTLNQSQQVTFSVPFADDYAQVYVDGQPVLQTGNASGYVGGGIPNTTSATITLPAGQHQVILEGVNTNGFNSQNPNGAGITLNVTSGGTTLLTTSNATQWLTTGYVNQLPSGWFSGAIGSFTFTEFVMQENAGAPIYQQQTYTVTTPAQNVSATSTPVSVTWYQYDLNLTASPTALPVTKPTLLSASSTTGGPVGDVIEIYDQTTGKVVGDSAPGASTYSANWTESSPSTDTFISYFKNPSTGSHDQASNTVDVEWQQIKLTLSDAEVYHTPHWLSNLTAYNQQNPSNQRPITYFWAGEELMFKVQPSISNIQIANVTLSGLRISSYAPPNAPINFTAPITVPLTYNPATGYLEGHTDPSWAEWFQYLENGTYTVQFYVKTQDNQVASTNAMFAIQDTWVSGNNSATYFHEQQTY